MNVIHNDNFCNWELRVHQEHCLSCFSSNCEHDLCTVRSCPWACPSRMHSCKMEDHELVCAKVKRPCPNKNNGCRAIINTTEIMRHLPGCPGGTVSCNFKWYRKCLDPDITNAISSRSRHQLDDLHKTYTRLACQGSRNIELGWLESDLNNLRTAVPVVVYEDERRGSTTPAMRRVQGGVAHDDDGGGGGCVDEMPHAFPSGLSRSIITAISSGDDNGGSRGGVVSGTPQECLSRQPLGRIESCLDETDRSLKFDCGGGGGAEFPRSNGQRRCGQWREERENGSQTPSTPVTSEGRGYVADHDSTGSKMDHETKPTKSTRTRSPPLYNSTSNSSSSPSIPPSTSPSSSPSPSSSSPSPSPYVPQSSPYTFPTGSTLNVVPRPASTCLSLAVSSIPPYPQRHTALHNRSVVHFEFVCLKSLRRDEYSSHAKFHRTLMEYTDINQIKCPLTYRGCGFTVKKRFPKKGQLQFDSILRCPSIRYHDVALDDYCNSKLANSDMYIKSKNYYDARRTAINSTDERIPNGSDMVPKVKTSLEQPPGDSRDLISQLPEEPLRLLLKCLDSIDLRNLSSCSPYWKCRLSWELPSRGIIDFGWMKYHKRWIRNEQEDSFSTHCSLPNVIEEQSESEIIRHIPICKFNNFLQSEKDYAKGIQMFTDSRYINR